MNLEEQVNKLKADIDVVLPFANRLMQRIQERFPDDDIRMCDIGFNIEIVKLNPAARIHRLLDDLIKEGISI